MGDVLGVWNHQVVILLRAYDGSRESNGGKMVDKNDIELT